MHVLHFKRLPASKAHIKSPANSSFPVVYMSINAWWYLVFNKIYLKNIYKNAALLLELIHEKNNFFDDKTSYLYANIEV